MQWCMMILAGRLISLKGVSVIVIRYISLNLITMATGKWMYSNAHNMANVLSHEGISESNRFNSVDVKVCCLDINLNYNLK